MGKRVAVVGAGVIGLAAASALHTAGAEVRCFEQAAPGQGESAGLTRIFRQAHGDPALVRLALQARAGWRAWEGRFGRRLLGEDGLLVTGAATVRHWESAMRQAGAPCRLLDAAEARMLLPIGQFHDSPILWDPAAGAIRARRTIDLLRAALDSCVVPATVHQIAPARTGLQLHTSAGAWECDAVVVAAGIDTPRLAAQVGIHLPTALARHVRFSYALRAPRPERLACWIDESGAAGAGLSSYGQPVGSTGHYAVGASRDDADYPATLAIEEVSRRARALARRYVQAALPGLDGEPVAELHCTSNRTGLPHGDGFGAEQSEGVVAIYGNNLFKFAPLLGDVLARAALKRELPDALTLYSHAIRRRVES